MFRLMLAASLLLSPLTLVGNLTGPQPAACCAPAPQTVEQGVCDPYVQITIQYGEDSVVGSGTVIRVAGEILVLSCTHVVECAFQETSAGYRCVPLTITRGKQTWIADPVYVSHDHDVALIRPRDPKGLVPADYCGNITPIRGEEVWYCGTPRGFHGSLERSIVNQVTPDGFLCVNGNGWYGNSGCGVYVVRGGRYVLVGVIVRLVWVDPRSPLLCESQSAINSVIAAYKGK